MEFYVWGYLVLFVLVIVIAGYVILFNKPKTDHVGESCGQYNVLSYKNGGGNIPGMISYKSKKRKISR